MSDKDEALRLADALDERVVPRWIHRTGDTPQQSGYKKDAECKQAAALLRHQHAENERLQERCDELGSDKDRWYRMAELHCSTITQLKAERDALLATLSRVADVAHNGGWVESNWLWLVVVIRRLTLPHFDRSGTTDQIKARVRAAIDAAKEAK